MAFRTKKISQMDPKGSNLASTDLLEISELVSGSYVTKSITGAEIIASVPPTTVDWGDIGGTLSSQTDLNTALSGKVPTTRTLTINGTTQDLSADRTFTVSTGITIGTTAITSGTVGRVLFEGTGNVVSESANLFWDNTNSRLSVGTSTQAYTLAVGGKLRVSAYSYWVDSGANALQVDGISSFSDAIILASGKTLQFGSSVTQIGGTSAGPMTFRAGSGNNQMSLFSTGNLLIQTGGTHTDAGYKLDVNGTVRLNGGTNGTLLFTGNYAQVLVGTNGFYISNNTGSIDLLRVLGDGRVGVGTNTPNASSLFDITSTTKGFLPPRMTTTQKNAIASPATGLVVYDSTLNKLCVRGASAWETITSL